MTPAASGSPSAREWGTKSEVAHLWARWLHNPCRLGEPLRYRMGGGIKSGPVVDKVATYPLPPRGAAPLENGGRNQEWPTNGQGGYITPAASGSPSATEHGGGGESKVANKWESWLHSPCRPGEPLCFTAGGGIEKWPIFGQGGYITLAASGSPSARERGAESKVAHLWARWLHNPCRLGEPLR